MTAMQCRMARAGLGWTVNQLAEAAEVRPGTVSSFERKNSAQSSTIKAIKQALLDTGKVRFEGETCVCIVGNSE